MKRLYQKGRIGDVEIKRRLVVVLNEFLDPIRQRRKEYADPKRIDQILREGTERSRQIATKVLSRVKGAMRLN